MKPALFAVLLLLFACLPKAFADDASKSLEQQPASAQSFVATPVSRRLAVVQKQAASLIKSIANEDSNGHTIYAKAGGRLEVYLPAQLGTGYGWYVAESDPKVLEQQGEPTTGEMTGNRGLGRQEMEIFVFAVKSAGTSKLSLEYKRPWMKVPPVRTWSITVVAR